MKKILFIISLLTFTLSPVGICFMIISNEDGTIKTDRNAATIIDRTVIDRDALG